MNKVGRLFIKLGITAVVTLIFGLAINYFALPAMTFQSSGFWWFWLVELIIAFATFCICGFAMDDYYEGKPVGTIVIGSVTVIWLVVFIVTAIAGSQMVNPYAYQQIATVEEGNYEEDIIEANAEDIIIVDVKTAQKLGDRTLGTLKNAPWYDVDDEYNLVTIKGVEYRISPVNYGDLFKYGKAKHEGITAYVLVNATQESAKLVMLEKPMKYSPSAFWAYDLSRHLRNQYPDYMFAKSFFEVDDSETGNPYWITGVKTPTIGMRGGCVIKTVVITDAVTGESNEYSVDNLPEWVDHAQSVDFLMDQAYWHYGYTEGFFNFSKTNVFRTSYHYRDQKSESSEENAADAHTPFEGYNSVKMKDGSIWFYTGITPANNAETNVGFLLLNPRTGVMRSYDLTGENDDTAGAEESSAQKAAEGLVSNMKYSASFPTIVNVDGEETYFMTLKDGAGLVQRYALCNVENYAKCVCASDIDEVIRLYRIEMGFIAGSEGGNGESNDKPAQDENREYKELSGVVTSVNEAQIGGYTYYYFMLEGETTIFMSSIENSNMQPMKLAEGANVTITYYESKEEGISIVTEIAFK